MRVHWEWDFDLRLRLSECEKWDWNMWMLCMHIFVICCSDVVSPGVTVLPFRITFLMVANFLFYRQLRARRALLQLSLKLKDVPLRTRRALLLYKVDGNSVLVLNGTSLIEIAPFWLSVSADVITFILCLQSV